MKPLTKLTVEEAAQFIEHGETIGVSGFTAAGASTGRSLDGALARAKAFGFRTPYQSDPDLRRSINAGETRFFDMHLSRLPQDVRYGFLGHVRTAIIEASDVTKYGEIVLTSSVGASPTFCSKADRIIIELNRYHPPFLRGLHDVFEPEDPPMRIRVAAPEDGAHSGRFRVRIPRSDSRFEPLNRAEVPFGVPALAGSATVLRDTPNRPKPGLQTGEVHGERAR